MRDWKAELAAQAARMRLPEGKTCSDCAFFKRCESFLSISGRETSCDWDPSRFVQRKTP